MNRLSSMALVAACLALSGSGVAEQGEPPICTQATAGSETDELEALADAEQAQWRRARSVEREARKLMRSTMGMGESERSVAVAAKIEELNASFAEAVRNARALCGCRERRGDPHREDCDRLYQRWIPPEKTRRPELGV